MMDKMLEPDIWNPTNFMLNNVKYEIAISEEMKQKLSTIEVQLYANIWIDKQKSNMVDIGEWCEWFRTQMGPWIKRHEQIVSWDDEDPSKRITDVDFWKELIFP